MPELLIYPVFIKKKDLIFFISINKICFFELLMLVLLQYLLYIDLHLMVYLNSDVILLDDNESNKQLLVFAIL